VSTLYYPQLSTGSISQFPTRKHILERTIVNRALSGRVVKMADPEGGISRWELSYSGLTDAELAALQDLFAACEGRLRTLVFLDPCGNLLRWTDAPTNPVWQTSMQILGEIEDPNGGASAWRVTNAAQAAQSFTQSANIPGWYRYTFSVWSRSSSTDHLVLKLANADGAVEVSRSISEVWQQVSISGEIPGEDSEIRCSIEIPAACAVDLYGPQLDAQSDASGYCRSNDRSGAYVARFDQDEFECITYGPDNHSTTVRLVSVREVTA
jgi:hypothetical protein